MFVELFTDYTIRMMLINTALLGMLTGTLGVFVLVRKQSMVGDAISHAALPGIALFFLLTHSRNPLVLLSGGALSGVVGILVVKLVAVTTRLKQDAILGVVLSVFFGTGLVLMTVIQKRPIAHQSVLNKFLFGNVATLLPVDLYVTSAITVLVLGALWLCWKECVLFSFDPLFAHTIGYRVRRIDAVLTALLVATIVIGLQLVGVVLMSSMLIAPAAAARQWCTQLWTMALLAAFFGAAAGMTGSLLSGCIAHLPTGPTIVVVLSLLVAVSFAGAPRRHAAHGVL